MSDHSQAFPASPPHRFNARRTIASIPIYIRTYLLLAHTSTCTIQGYTTPLAYQSTPIIASTNPPYLKTKASTTPPPPKYIRASLLPLAHKATPIKVSTNHPYLKAKASKTPPPRQSTREIHPSTSIYMNQCPASMTPLLNLHP